MTRTDTAVAVTIEQTGTELELVAKITSNAIVPADEAPLLAEVVIAHSASLPAIQKLVDEFGFGAREIELIYHVRDSLMGNPEAADKSMRNVSLASLARTGRIFPDIMQADPDDLASEIEETLRAIRRQYHWQTLHAGTVLERLCDAHRPGMDFRQALDFVTEGSAFSVDDDGELMHEVD